ncbi:MAG: SAM-dependent methyltransferase [Rhodothermales bacterium]|jgi:SAM-dependent methyltransferase
MNDDPFSIFSGNSIKTYNKTAWDTRAKSGCRFSNTAPTSEYQKAAEALAGNPWLPDNISGLAVLNLASGGGGQSGLLASLGASVTVVDISPVMLENDRRLAQEQGYDIRVIEASMDHLPMLQDAEFDLVIHPVSTCYLPNLQDVFEEVARVSKSGATYINHHKQPASMQTSADPVNGHYQLLEPYAFKGPLPPVTGKMHREDGTLEFLHSLQDLLGGLCKAGFYIDDFKEADHADPDAAPGSFGHRSAYVPPFMSIKAVRRERAHLSTIIT